MSEAEATVPGETTREKFARTDFVEAVLARAGEKVDHPLEALKAWIQTGLDYGWKQNVPGGYGSANLTLALRHGEDMLDRLERAIRGER